MSHSDGTHAIVRFKAYGSTLDEVKKNAAAEAHRVLGADLLDYRMHVDMEPIFVNWAHSTTLYEADVTVEPIQGARA